MIPLNFDLISVGTTVAGIAILGFTIFFNDRNSVTSRTFIIFSGLTILWSIANYLQYQVSGTEIGLWVVRTIVFIGCWHALIFFQLCYVFPERTFIFPKLYTRALLPLVGIVSVLTLTPVVFERATSVTARGVVTTIQNGPGIILFVLIVFSLIAGGVGVILWKAYQRSGKERTRILLMGLGMFMTFSCIIYFNIVLPTMFGDSSFLPLSAIFLFPFIALTAYAIYRYKLLNIKVLTTEIVAFFLSVSTMFQMVFATSAAEYLFRISVFILVLVFSILVVKSVIQEVRQRELIEKQEQELEVNNARLRELDKQKTEFLSFASHQLRTPLTAIKWSAAAALDGSYGEVPEHLREPIQTIFDYSVLMAVFINDYLNVSRIEQGRMEYRFAAINLPKVIEDSTKELRVGIEKKGLTLTLVLPQESVMIWADPDKLTQVFTNLIDNAMKYTPQGGITVTLERHAKDGLVRVIISDTGIGMDEETRKTLFAKFTRGDNARQVNSAGSGLGLFIVKTFIEAHKGTIHIESDGIGKGSRFILEFPLLVQRGTATV